MWPGQAARGCDIIQNGKPRETKSKTGIQLSNSNLILLCACWRSKGYYESVKFGNYSYRIKSLRKIASIPLSFSFNIVISYNIRLIVALAQLAIIIVVFSVDVKLHVKL